MMKMCWSRWTAVVVGVVVLLCELTVSAADKQTVVNYTGYKVIRVYPKTAEEIDVVRSLEDDLHPAVDLWGETSTSSNRSLTAVDLHVGPRVYDEFTSRLRRYDVHFDIIITDLQRTIDEQRLESEQHRAARRQRRSVLEQDDEDDDIVGLYASHNEINDWLRTLKGRHPNIVELIDVGRSYEGRHLLAIKIGHQSTALSSTKPAIWIDAGIHAREWIAPATAVYIIHQLVSGYGSNTLATLLVNSYDWFILPVFNPDGYEFSNTTDRMWRKTRSHLSNGRSMGCVGVDANRNFDFNWQTECTGHRRCPGMRPCQNIFAGRHPLSEPETSAVANFLMRHRSSIRLYLSFHSYSQLWLTPWAYTTTPPADNNDLMRVAFKAVEALEAVHNTDYVVGSPAVILYSATGGSYDWAKGVAGIKYSYTLELRDRGRYGFLLPRSQIIPTGEETWAAIQAAVDEMESDECWVRGRNCL